jgi:hypothetical protein
LTDSPASHSQQLEQGTSAALRQKCSVFQRSITLFIAALVLILIFLLTTFVFDLQDRS